MTITHPSLRGARSVVTGGAGFIGSHLVERLLADGHAVLVIDDGSTGRMEQVPGAATLEAIDIAAVDPGPVIRAWAPDVVFHLAAQSSVPRSAEDPERDLAVNVAATHRVAAAALAAGARRLVFVSSGGAVYGEATRPASERSRPRPASYYGIHKLAAEGHVSISGVPFAIARPSNVYGPRQQAGLEGAVVAAFVEQAMGGDVLRIHGDGHQTRDLIHVADVVAGLVALGEGSASGIWNIAQDRSVSILDLADIIERRVGRPLERDFQPRRRGDVRRSAMTAARLRTIGWAPAWDLEAGIAALLDRHGADAAREAAHPRPDAKIGHALPPRGTIAGGVT